MLGPKRNQNARASPAICLSEDTSNVRPWSTLAPRRSTTRRTIAAEQIEDEALKV